MGDFSDIPRAGHLFNGISDIELNVSELCDCAYAIDVEKLKEYIAEMKAGRSSTNPVELEEAEAVLALIEKLSVIP